METEDNYTKSLAYRLFRETQSDNLEYCYRGKFNTEITDNILSLAEASLRLSEHKLKIKKRVYFVMVEGLQNITRHQDLTTDKIPVKPGFFVLQRKELSYFITTGNLIEDKNIEMLKQQIDQVNELSKEELDTYYKKHLTGGKISDKGGAGLGLIEMARKSKGKLAYSFRKINEKYFYFYLLTAIPFSDVNIEEIDINYDQSLNNIRQLHNVLNEENIILNYSGIFNQENLVNLLGIIEKLMKGTIILKIKTFNIMVEILQNLVKHSDYYKLNKQGGLFGIFFISEFENKFTLTTGNFVNNKKKENLQQHIEKVNILSISDLNDWYEELLMSPDDEQSTNGGLGLIDMRLRSQNFLQYDFYQIDSDFMFFTLRVDIDKVQQKLEPIEFEGSADKPSYHFNRHNKKFCIKGRSIPENALEFYQPIFDWLDDYIDKPNVDNIFEFKFEYFNTLSAHQLFKIMRKLVDLSKKSIVTVKWYYQKEDKDMAAAGLRFRQMLDLNIELIEWSNIRYS